MFFFSNVNVLVVSLSYFLCMYLCYNNCMLMLHTLCLSLVNKILNLESWIYSLCCGICENVFHFFTLTCRKPPNSFGILQPLSNKTNRNTTTVPAEGNSSKHPIVFNNCQVTNNNKIIFLKTTNKRYYLFRQCYK